ncbi:MAG: hypothetical protein M1838_004120 [Thelocarpon superellum]|nr:MAG: hypothetical protein M1838_004120 [Thelocarpon superellum]
MASTNHAGYERDMLFLIEKIDPDEDGFQQLPKLLDHFSVEGPNGSHECLVLEPMGPMLSLLKSVDVIGTPWWRAGERSRYLLPTWLSKDISRQILRGLSCLHRHGIVHGGERTKDGGRELVQRGLSLEHRLDREQPDDMSDEEMQDLLVVLRHVLSYDHRARPTASQLLTYRWFSNSL